MAVQDEGFDPKTRYPGSAERLPEHERHVSVKALTPRQREVLSWMGTVPHAVTSRDAQRLGFVGTRDAAYNVGTRMEELWEETDLVDRWEFRIRTDSGGYNLAHVYRLTAGGRAVQETLGDGGD